MNSKGRKIAILIIVALIVVASISIFLFTLKEKLGQTTDSEQDDFSKEDQSSSEDVIDLHFSGWVPYWDSKNSIDEVVRYEENLDEVILFAAIFTAPNDKILLLDELDDTKKQIDEKRLDNHKIFLSFTNDYRILDGTYISKDMELLKRLLQTESSRKDHIEELIHLAHSCDVDGIEIDYEQMHKDKSIWPMYIAFIEELYPKCVEENLELRVVLNWKDVEDVVFPEGPDYVIMCYNLYGTHSKNEGGPKADIAFLSKVYELNKKLPGSVQMALANGGFSWSSEGVVKAVTQDMAVDLQKQFDVSPKRDDGSGALYFEYIDDGIEYEVWYADSKTLRTWIDLGIRYGYTSFGIWRMGGDSTDDMTTIFEGKGF